MVSALKNLITLTQWNSLFGCGGANFLVVGTKNSVETTFLSRLAKNFVNRKICSPTFKRGISSSQPDGFLSVFLIALSDLLRGRVHTHHWNVWSNFWYRCFTILWLEKAKEALLYRCTRDTIICVPVSSSFSFVSVNYFFFVCVVSTTADDVRLLVYCDLEITDFSNYVA